MFFHESGAGAAWIVEVSESGVFLLSEQFGEQVATLHFPALSAALTVFAPKQADDYIGVRVARPFRPSRTMYTSC